jgi:cyclopropane fatty-acyl-phospholipid synthase-like methyltransferase
MHSHSFALARRVVASFGLTAASRFLDVAGGSGSYSIAAALEVEGLHATVLDLPAVCDVTRAYAEKHGVADRVTAVAGDMFGEAAWPNGATELFFSDIFHDWDDERCAQLARRAFETLVPGGRILVHEMTLDPTKDGPLNAIAYSMVMVFVTEGRQRTVEELFALLRGAGFADPEAARTAEGYRLISARK